MLFFSNFFLFTGNVYAQSISINGKTNAPDICAHAVKHEPEEDVEHKPDLGFVDPFTTQAITPPEFLEFPLTIDLADFLNQPALPTGTLQEAPIGNIRVYLDGRVLYNGKEISQQLSQFCNHSDDKESDLVEDYADKEPVQQVLDEKSEILLDENLKEETDESANTKETE